MPKKTTAKENDHDEKTLFCRIDRPARGGAAARAWETNYGTHSEVRFETDGTMTVTVDNVGDMVDVPGKWVLKGTTLTATIEKNFDENGDLADKPTKTVYTWADYMTDAIIDDGDQSIADAREKYEKGTEWYVSENYLYFGGSVWVPLKH